MFKSLGGLAIATTTALYWGSPLFVVGEFGHAVTTGDSDAVNGLIDFPALRASLKEEARQIALYRLTGQDQPRASWLGGLASAAMEPFVSALVDNVTSPDGIRSFLNSQAQRRRQNQQNRYGPVDQLESLGQVLSKTRFGYRSWNTFVVSMKDQSNRTLGLTFDRRGFSNWKLVAVDLPPDGSFTP